MKWFKLHTRIIHSSINYQLSLDEQMTFVKLLALTAELDKNGIIVDGDGQPLPHDFISELLHVPLEVLETTIKKCIDTKRINENGSGIEILKWKEYQSDYTRQKPYRQAKKEAAEDPDRFIKGKYGGVVKR